MYFAVFGLGLLSVILAWAVMNARSKLSRMADLSQRSEHQLRGSIEAKEIRLTEAAEELADQQNEIIELTEEKNELRQTLSTSSSEIHELTLEAEALRTQEHELKAQVDELKTQVDGLERQLQVLHGGTHPDDLWRLELARSERTWRHSVATSPDGDSPFSSASDDLKLAVEIEASALREEVGAYTSVSWQADQPSDPAHRHRVLRVAQELLNQAARDPQPVELVATSNDEAVVLKLVTEGETGTSSPIEATDLIEISTDDGIVVTVH